MMEATEKHYPRFLCKNPKFLGLDFVDLIIIGAGLFFSLSLGGDSVYGTILIFACIGIHKIFEQKIDPVGLILGLQKIKRIDPLSMYRQSKKGGHK